MVRGVRRYRKREENKGKWGEVREIQIKRDKMEALQGHGFTEVLVFA